jgi:chloramphenicol 3-O-phosphotransferase
VEGDEVCYYESMNNAQVLILHGSPGSGKSTLADAIAECLREAGIPHAKIDIDEIAIIHPPQPPSFSMKNLKAIWPNYTAAVPNLKMIIPTVIDDEEELKLFKDSLPASKFIVCELTAPESALKERVTAREPNEYWANRLLGYVDMYHERRDHSRIRDFEVSTYNRTVTDAAKEVIEKAGWQV